MTPDQLQADFDELDEQRARAQRTADDCAARAEAISARLEAMRSAAATLEGLPPLAPLLEWRDHSATWRKALCDELLALPQRIRTGHDLGRLQNLRLSVLAIDRGLGPIDGSGYCLETLRVGQLMREAGCATWRGSLPDVERRIKELTARRDEAQAALDEAQLDDAERERRAAEARAQDAKPQRKTRGDGSRFDRYPDGRRVEVEVTT